MGRPYLESTYRITGPEGSMTVSSGFRDEWLKITWPDSFRGSVRTPDGTIDVNAFWWYRQGRGLQRHFRQVIFFVHCADGVKKIWRMERPESRAITPNGAVRIAGRLWREEIREPQP